MKLWEECTLEEKIERWQNVLRVLEALTPTQRAEQFYMGAWGFRNECHTTMCIAGWCGVDPWFKSLDFVLDFVPHSWHAGEQNGVIGDTTAFFGDNADDAIFVYNEDIETVEDAIEAVKLYITGIPERHNLGKSL